MKICSVLPAAIVHMQLCIQQAVIYLQNISSCYLSFYFTEFECFNIKLCDRWWFILLFYIVFKRSSNLSCNTFPWFPKLSQLWEVSQVVDKLIFMMKLNIVFLWADSNNAGPDGRTSEEGIHLILLYRGNLDFMLIIF